MRAIRPRPLRLDSTSSWSYQTQVTSIAGSVSSAASFEQDRAAGLHVGGAATPQDAVGIEAGGQVPVHRDGVQVPGDHDPAVAAEVRARDDRVAVAEHLEVREPDASATSTASATSRLVAGHRLDVDELPRELDGGGGQVERGHLPSLRADTLGPCPAPGVSASPRSRPTARCSTPGSPHPRSAPRLPEASRGPVPAELAPHLGPDPRRDVHVEFSTGDRSSSTLPRHPPPMPTCACTCSATCWCKPNTVNLDGIFGQLPIVVWTTAGPMHPDAYARLRPTLQRAGNLGARHRQVPAAARLRDPAARAHRRRLAGAPRRPPRAGHHRHARGLRQLQRRHARHLDGRGPDLAGRRRRRRLRHRRRRLDHGDAVGRRNRARLDRRARPARRQLRASASRSATTRWSRRGCT